MHVIFPCYPTAFIGLPKQATPFNLPKRKGKNKILMNSPTEFTILGGWYDMPVDNLERRLLKLLKRHLKKQKQPRLKKIFACGTKCVRGQLILILYTASDGKCYEAILHDDIDKLYVSSVEEHISNPNP